MNRPLRITAAIGAVGLTAAAVAGAAIGFGHGSASTTNTSGPVTSTERVTRGTLTQTQQVNGTLDYGTPVPVNASGSGVLTWLPELGAVIQRGQPAYKVDNKPISLFYGALPLYRQLHTGDTGDDVEEVEQNLAALGYSGLTVDKSYTAATASAVWNWQHNLGLQQTGMFDSAAVVIAVTQLRVVSLAAHLGDHLGGPVLTYSGTTRIVRISLDVALQRLAKQGSTATVTLPDGTTVNGTVATVGTVATAGQTANDPATIQVTVAMQDQSALGTLDQAPVAVTLVSAKLENVLTVPVGALVALAEGGYGVQVVTGSTSRYVPVQLGMFANGRVQITGQGITEGTLVGVPS